MLTPSIDHQHSLFTALEELTFELRHAERELRIKRPRGPLDAEGQQRTRGRRLAFCAHPNCGGVRQTWGYRGLRFCARDWRTRKAVYKDITEANVRGLSLVPRAVPVDALAAAFEANHRFAEEAV